MMKFTHRHYVPCLRWKKGEYEAVGQLSDVVVPYITPLIEVPEVGYDFASRRPVKTIDDHLAPFAERVRQKWGSRDAFVDARHIADCADMADGTHPMEFVLNGLRNSGCSAIPVTDCDRDAAHQGAVKRAAARDGNGICVRISIEFAASPSVRRGLDRLLSGLKVAPEGADFILDLGAPNFEPVAGFSRAVLSIIDKLPYVGRWRTLTLLGTSFPSSMAEVKRGRTRIPRNEWTLYQTLMAGCGAKGIRMAAFGDYAINHPDLLLMDMRIVKPSGTIRYTIDEEWLIVKGTSVRAKGGYKQFHSHSMAIITSGDFMGSDFSAGDKYISECAARDSRPGNLTTWRKVGTNHHLEKVARDVAKMPYP